MRNACRPMGRFFCLLKWLAAVVAMAATMAAQTNGPAMTQVVDTVYRADGTASKGTVLISWPAFTTADGTAVAAGSLSIQLGSGGAFAASLAPNTGAQPAGVYYKVVYQLSGQEPSTEYWVVPATGSTTIGAVRAKLQPPTIAAQVLTRDVADTNYVHVAGDQTIGGVKMFAALGASSIQGIQYVCQQNGADIGAKLQSAFNNLPTDSAGHKFGTMSFDGCSGYYSWNTPVTMTGARVKITANSSASKIEMQCNTANCLTLNVPASAASSDGDNMSVFSGWEMDGNNSITGQCGITVADVYNVALRDLKFYGFSASGSSPICIQSNAANSTGVEGLKLADIFFVDNYYGVNFANHINSANGASFGYGEWTGVRWFTNVSGSAFVNLPSGTLHNTTIHLNANVNASNATVFRSSGTQYGSGPGTALWLDKLYVVGECTSGCNGTATTFDLGMGTAATVWLEWHNSANLNLAAGAGTLTQLGEGAYDHQTITYAGHKPFCSGTTDPNLASIGGNYQACMLPYGSGSYVQGYSWNMTYDRANQRYTCPGDGNANGCSAALANNAGNINFVAIPFNGGSTQNISEVNILNRTVMKLDSAGTHFSDGITQKEVANIDTSGNATVQNLTVKGTCAGCGSGGGGGDLSSPPAIGSVTPNAGTFTTLASQTVNGVPNAARFGGNDPCAKINAAIASLDAAAGGTVEARGFTAADLATSCSTTLTIDRPVRLELPSGVMKLGGNPGLKVTAASGVLIEGQGWDYGYVPSGANGTILRSTGAYPLIFDTGSQGVTVVKVELDGNSIGTVGYLGPMAGGMQFHDSHIHHFIHMGLFITGGVNDFRNLLINNNGGDGMVISSDSVVEGNTQIAYNGGTGLHLVSGGDRVTDADSDHNGLHNVWADGNPVLDWTASTQIIAPRIYKPTAQNPGGYYFFPGNIGGRTGTSAPVWCQTQGCTVSDGTVTWYNVNIVGGAVLGFASNHFFANLYLDDAGTKTVSSYPSFQASNLRMDGLQTDQSYHCVNTHLTAIYTSQGQVLNANADGIHLKGCDHINASGMYVQGQGFDPATLNPDQGGLVLEEVKWSNFDNYFGEFNQRSALQLLNNTQNNQFSNVYLFSGSSNTTASPYNHALYSDGASWANQMQGLTIYSRNTNSFGIYSNTSSGNFIDNYMPLGTGAGSQTFDTPLYTVFTNAHGRTTGNVVEYDVGTTQALTIDTGGRVSVGGDLSVRDIPGHEYFVSKYASIQAAIDAAYNNGTVQGGATVVDDRLAPYIGPGFIAKDSVTVKLAATTYTITGAVTYNNGVGNVTAGIISMPGSHIVGVGTSTNHGTNISAGAGLNADLIATSTLGTGTGTSAQWWHWGSIESLNINGASQTSGRCLVVENMGETARVENILARSCYGNNIEIIGSSASQSSIRNITTMRSQTASGLRFTNLAGVGKVDGLSGDCNPTSLVSVQENAAGSLTILGLKAEGESSICTGQVHDPVVLLDGVSGFNDHVRIIGGYAFGTAQSSFAKFVNAGNAILETEGLYITGYTNMLNDTVRGVTVPLSSSTSKQPFYYEPGGTTYANQAFTLTGGTFIQGQPATTPTEIFGLTTGSATLLAAAGNGDNSSVLTGGIQISGQNRTQYGTPPEIMARWGYRWLGAGLGYDTTNFDLVPAWNSSDSSTRNLGNPLTVCQKGSSTVSCRWPHVYASNADALTFTLGTYTVSGLPTTYGAGTLAWVSNGSSSSDCTAGGGSNRVLCYYTGSAWTAASSSGGSGVASFNGRTNAVTPQASDYSSYFLSSAPGALPSGTTIPWGQVTNQPAIPAAGSTTPNMDGTGAAGSSSNYARADHVHPSDSSRVATASIAAYGACGDSTHVCQVTTNSQGLVTNESAVAIAAGSTNIPYWSNQVAAGSAIAMAGTANKVYCYGIRIDQPITVTYVGMFVAAGDGTGNYSVQIFPPGSNQSPVFSSTAVHVTASAGAEQQFNQAGNATWAATPGIYQLCTTGTAATATMKGSATPMWNYFNQPSGLSSSGGLISGTLTSTVTPTFMNSAPTVVMH
jgi:hypothetical protein